MLSRKSDVADVRINIPAAHEAPIFISICYNNLMTSLKSQIQSYIPYDQRETNDKSVILQCLDTFPDTLTRENRICHFTASDWIINPDRSKALMIHHNIQRQWMWPGGHADGKDNLLQVALREAHEETGLTHIRTLSPEIFSLEIFTVPAHIRRGQLVNAHLHLNCSFLFEATEQDTIHIKPDENNGIRWITFTEIIKNVDAGKMSPHYCKLIEKCSKY